MYGELPLRPSQRVKTTEAHGANGLAGGICAPTMGDGVGAFRQNTVFFPTIWPLMCFGSARRRLRTVKNLLMAPGGSSWGCDVGCTCNRGGIGLLWRGLSHPTPPCRRVSCHLLSQEEEPLAMPGGRCNFLMTKPF